LPERVKLNSLKERPVKNFQYVIIAFATVVTIACGGGGSGTAPDPVSPAATTTSVPVITPTATTTSVPVITPAAAITSVTAITSAAPLSYGKTAVLVITGSNLDKGLNLTAPGCSPLSELAGSTATSRNYNCAVAAATSLQVNASDSAGTALFSVTLAVPDPQVTVLTSKGTITLELNPARAPISVNNFLKYTNDGFYTNLIFHRVIASFVIQSGGFTSGPRPKTATYAPIKLESNNGLSNLRGTLAMARLADPNFNSATSQFFINVVDNAFLNYVSATQPQYAVFGKVVSGMDVVDAIRLVPTVNTPLADLPVTDVRILSASQTR
jgi:cyclophilin family peptidyl-prolyl cis-trans isomerase